MSSTYFLAFSPTPKNTLTHSLKNNLYIIKMQVCENASSFKYVYKSNSKVKQNITEKSKICLYQGEYPYS